jgi:DNA-directed RNA polymerase subunit RPC12/RpoP
MPTLAAAAAGALTTGREGDMALLKCSECGSQVADKAWTCWKCGAPVLSEEERPVATTPQRSKAAKANLAIAAILVLLGIGSWVVGNPAWGVGLVGLGLIWGLVTRIYGWRRYG